MKICFLGSSHLTLHSAVAAAQRSFQPVFQDEIDKAELTILAHDTPTNKDGIRDMTEIERLMDIAMDADNTIVITSQLSPGWFRNMYGPSDEIYLQPETLRMIDASSRALNPERIVVGCENPHAALPPEYQRYLAVFSCPILKMTYEEAEFSKIAVNMALASQVDYANRMKSACEKIGADWSKVKEAVHLDSRIGKNAYLTPGRWQDSIHLLRDYVTLKEIEDAR